MHRALPFLNEEKQFCGDGGMALTKTATEQAVFREHLKGD